MRSHSVDPLFSSCDSSEECAGGRGVARHAGLSRFGSVLASLFTQKFQITVVSQRKEDPPLFQLRKIAKQVAVPPFPQNDVQQVHFLFPLHVQKLESAIAAIPSRRRVFHLHLSHFISSSSLSILPTPNESHIVCSAVGRDGLLVLALLPLNRRSPSRRRIRASTSSQRTRTPPRTTSPTITCAPPSLLTRRPCSWATLPPSPLSASPRTTPFSSAPASTALCVCGPRSAAAAWPGTHSRDCRSGVFSSATATTALRAADWGARCCWAARR